MRSPQRTSSHRLPSARCLTFSGEGDEAQAVWMSAAHNIRRQGVLICLSSFMELSRMLKEQRWFVHQSVAPAPPRAGVGESSEPR